MSDTLVSGLIQLAISIGGAGLLVQLLMLRQNRRKIAGEATANEANAASTLSGAALKMVENAQQGQREAELRAERLEEKNSELDDRLEEARRAQERQRWRIHHLEMRTAVLENALKQTGVEIPPEPHYEAQEISPPPTQAGPTPSPPALPGPAATPPGA